MSTQGETRKETCGSVVVEYGTGSWARMDDPSCTIFARYTDPISMGVIEFTQFYLAGLPREPSLDEAVEVVLTKCREAATRTSMALDDLARLRALEDT